MCKYCVRYCDIVSLEAVELVIVTKYFVLKHQSIEPVFHHTSTA